MLAVDFSMPKAVTLKAAKCNGCPLGGHPRSKLVAAVRSTWIDLRAKVPESSSVLSGPMQLQRFSFA